MLIKKIFLIIIGVIFFPTIATAESLSYPTIKGEYLVCPNGRTIPKYFWSNIIPYPENSFNPKDIQFRGNFGYRALGNKKNFPKISMIISDLIIGKEAKNMPKEAIQKIKKRMLWGDLNPPTKYKDYSKSIGPVYQEKLGHKNIQDSKGNWSSKPIMVTSDILSYISFGMKNSEGKFIELRWTNKPLTGPGIIDNDGKFLKSDFKGYTNGILYCKPESMNYRVVQQLELEDITNEYGEIIELPIMFWMVEVRVKSDPPKSENNYNF